jgi:hypothetical protein
VSQTMPRAVSGYEALDGSFHESLEDCELHEAAEELRDLLAGTTRDPDELFELIRSLMPQVERYVNAVKAIQSKQVTSEAIVSEQGAVEDTYGLTAIAGSDRLWPDGKGYSAELESLRSSAGIDQADDGETEERPSAVQQQPVGRRRAMPNVGRRPRTEAVPDEGEEHGAGVWGGYARSVRRD